MKTNPSIFRPSTYKVSTKQVEFVIVDKDSPKNQITCQVKNLAQVDYTIYEKYDSFRTIYLFSGINDYNGGEEGKRYGNCEIIDRRTLFHFFKENALAAWMRSVLKDYYSWD